MAEVVGQLIHAFREALAGRHSSKVVTLGQGSTNRNIFEIQASPAAGQIGLGYTHEFDDPVRPRDFETGCRTIRFRETIPLDLAQSLERLDQLTEERAQWILAVMGGVLTADQESGEKP